MNTQYNFNYFQGNSFSQLFAQDIADAGYTFILNYPATSSWAAYPNTKKYFLQDGSDEATKTSYDKICEKEPWKNLAVLGDILSGVVLSQPGKVLVDYWREHFGFSYNNLEVIESKDYLDEINKSDRLERVITLFPFDGLLPQKHAVDPDTHYRLLSKATLAELGVSCPKYETYNLHETNFDEIKLPEQFPYLIKTSHGLSGEGTYIIKSASELNYCCEEIKKYLNIKLLDTIIVSEFIKDAVENYCVQFYVNKVGDITLIGVTRQLVSPEGKYLGGLIYYGESDMSKFYEMIAAIGQYAHKQGYFGIIGFDVLEDKDGQLFAIDANFRVNGSTPLCLQRNTLLELGKEVANYSTDYWMDGTLDSILVTLKEEIERKDLIILSALERVKYGKIYTELYGIVTGETLEDMQRIDQKMHDKGLQLVS
ncbi:ATP-grasp domain-containing protein [Microcoleus sp. FACHB-831]|uniref:ATP-grasp domain-containing protein n=1 Tax=Microcoleus sp. FACHB-831 TaxID=2692827 RepID=UPI0016850E27|nr:ATP-grasp domain-containing protein [Microcoleus sp. FACHB-831]MBD1922968.1 ATP-grasp domain-containing protein [Microcoleus sp. FACHB-831]